MSKYEITDIDKLKNGLKAVAELVNEPRIKLAADGWKLVAMDPANVAMVMWSFKAYNSIDHKDAEICFKMPEFRKILARAGKDDKLTINILDNRIELVMAGKSTKKFSVPMIEPEDKEQRLPDLKFEAELLVESDVFSGVIDDASLVGESVTFSCETENLVATAEGELNKFHTCLTVGIGKGGAAKSKYSLEYLNKMKSAEKMADKVNVKFSKDYPLMLVYGDLSFILAPRIEND